MDKSSHIYMMGSSSRRALYAGVCADLKKRVWEHKNGLDGDFTQKYKCNRLVYFEKFSNVVVAISREKEVKGWRRSKKNKLVESLNPEGKTLLRTGIQMDCCSMMSRKSNEAQGPSILLTR